MATRFAVVNGNWNTGATWDNGAVPVAGDTVYPNGWTVTIDTDINVASLNNNIPTVYLPDMCIPKMTSNSQPSGVVNASDNISTAFQAFDQDSSSYWTISANTTPFISYQFTSQKTIKRYYFTNFTGQYMSGWLFQGSNDGSNWTTIETVTGAATLAYTSGATVAANTTAYLYYRINVTSLGIPSNGARILRFEMTESTATTYGTGSGGSFTVPSSLVGTRNIEFTGAGLQSYAAFASNLLTLDNNLTNTVNINKTVGAYIINPLFNGTANSSSGATAININNNGIVNINGDIYGTTVVDGAAPLGLIRIVSNSTVTVNGNLYPLAGRSNVASYIINLLPTSTNATLTINGSIFGGNLYSNTYSIFVQAVGTININGNLTSNSGYCILGSGSIFLNITGIVSFTNASSVGAISLGGNAAVNVTGAVSAPPNFSAIVGGGGAINVLTGIVTAGTNAVGINAASSSLVTLGNSPLINTNGYMAVAAPKIRLYSPANVQWVFQDNIASNKVLYSAGGSIGLPLTTNVRNNIQYGASNELTGTMIVPTNPNVRMGVQVDVQPNVGTADLTAQDIFTAIAVSPDPVAERLRNVSTVQTTGDQLAAF